MLVKGHPGRKPKLSATALRRSTATINGIVCAEYNLAPSMLFIREQTHPVTIARHIAWYLCTKLLDGWSYSTIGRAYGAYHHTTVIHGAASVGKLRDEIVGFREVVDKLETLARAAIAAQRCEGPSRVSVNRIEILEARVAALEARLEVGR